MRTTLDFDDDVLAAAKALAKAGQTTAGRILSLPQYPNRLPMEK